jgi:hypothetical protein
MPSQPHSPAELKQAVKENFEQAASTVCFSPELPAEN